MSPKRTLTPEEILASALNSIRRVAAQSGDDWTYQRAAAAFTEAGYRLPDYVEENAVRISGQTDPTPATDTDLDELDICEWCESPIPAAERHHAINDDDDNLMCQRCQQKQAP